MTRNLAQSCRVKGLALTAVILACILSVDSQAGDRRAGQLFAIENCSRCHAVGSAGISPLPKAPPFRLIARKYKLEDLEESFAEGMVTGHNAMPEFTLSTRQIDDLLAHMQRLKKR